MCHSSSELVDWLLTEKLTDPVFPCRLNWGDIADMSIEHFSKVLLEFIRSLENTTHGILKDELRQVQD